MKQILATAAAAAVILASALPVLADDHNDHNDRNHARDQHARAVPTHRRVAAAPRYREGQVWHGHHLAYRGGNWGYYAPRNGTQVFISIPL